MRNASNTIRCLFCLFCLLACALAAAPAARAQDRFELNAPFAVTVAPPPPTGALTFSPVAGTYTGAQTITVSTTLSSASVFCTQDGTPANAAATFVGTAPASTNGSPGGVAGTISVPSSQTLNCQAVQGAVTHQALPASSSGWKVVIATCTVGGVNVCNRGTPTATSGGGVGSAVPTTWAYSWGGGGGGSVLSESMTAPAFVQILAPFSGSSNDSATMLVQRKIAQATVASPTIQNNEADSQSFDSTHKVGGMTIEHNFGLQCEQAPDVSCPGHWAIGGGNASGSDHWACTSVTASCPWPANTPVEFATQGHWTLSDTGCAGYGCFYYDWLEVNGTRYDLSHTQWVTGFPLGAMANETVTWPSFMGSQDQLDNYNTTATIGRQVSYAAVTVGTYSAAPVLGSAAYVIH